MCTCLCGLVGSIAHRIDADLLESLATWMLDVMDYLSMCLLLNVSRDLDLWHVEFLSESLRSSLTFVCRPSLLESSRNWVRLLFSFVLLMTVRSLLRRLDLARTNCVIYLIIGTKAPFV